MRQDARVRRTTRSRDRYRELIHLLNQRYHREFDRAERLQAELADINASRAWRLLSWLRGLKKWLLGMPASATKLVPPLRRGEYKGGCSPAPPAHPPSSPPFVRGDKSSSSPLDALAAPISIIIPFRDHVELLHDCLTSLRRSSYRRFEVILVDNGSTEPGTHRYLQRFQGQRRRRIVPAPGPFNFSRLCNLGAEQARGDYLLFLNNDTEVLAPDWLEQMLIVAQQAQTGIVGATLFYPDLTIQHAGMIPQPGGAWNHVYRGCPCGYEREHGELRCVREVPAVTGACLLIERGLFLDLGGFDERLPVTDNDVDLCRRVRERGLRVVVTPHAQLLHHESLSRGYTAELPNA